MMNSIPCEDIGYGVELHGGVLFNVLDLDGGGCGVRMHHGEVLQAPSNIHFDLYSLILYQFDFN